MNTVDGMCEALFKIQFWSDIMPLLIDFTLEKVDIFHIEVRLRPLGFVVTSAPHASAVLVSRPIPP